MCKYICRKHFLFYFNISSNYQRMSYLLVQTIVIGLVYWDMPYGILAPEVAPWDVLITPKELADMLKGVASVNQETAWTVVLMVHWRQLREVAEVLEQEGYTNISTVVWHKTEFQGREQANQLTNSLEYIITARKESTSGVKAFYNLNSNPKDRHNFFECPAKVTKLKHGGKTVNVTQKPSAVARYFLDRFHKPGTKFLVFGAGAGGEVRAGLRLGLDVVAVEKSKFQFEALHCELNRMAATIRAKQHSHIEEEETSKPEAAPTERDQDVCAVCGTKMDETSGVRCVNCSDPCHRACTKGVATSAAGEQDQFCLSCHHKLMSKGPKALAEAKSGVAVAPSSSSAGK